MIAVLAFALGGPNAGARKKGNTWGASIKLQHPTPTRFRGTVHSSLAACFRGRVVTLQYTDPSGDSALLSVQRTNRKGRFVVNLTQPAFQGFYQARVHKSRVRAGQTCRAAKSRKFGV